MSSDMSPATELTLIVAATRSMGIGKAGGLPWTGLKKEMAYFARVTKRIQSPSQFGKNTVVMGRKTWDSIPPKFRPLKGRLNIVLSRSYPSTIDPSEGEVPADGPVKLSSISAAVSHLQSTQQSSAATNEPTSGPRIFIIGGAEIYKASLSHPEAKRLLITRVLNDFECDAFLDLDLEGDWRKCAKEELDEWTGEVVPEGEQEENGTRYVFEMWVRR